MFNIVLYEPEIPPNTGNVIRLCVNAGCKLHLIKPLGFTVDDSKLKRAGLDYRDWADVEIHEQFSDCLTALASSRFWFCETTGIYRYSDVSYSPGDAIVFGPETRGLPHTLLDQIADQNKIYIPMQKHNRSLNLSNAVAIVTYEAWRQLGFTNSANK